MEKRHMYAPTANVVHVRNTPVSRAGICGILCHKMDLNAFSYDSETDECSILDGSVSFGFPFTKSNSSALKIHIRQDFLPAGALSLC